MSSPSVGYKPSAKFRESVLHGRDDPEQENKRIEDVEVIEFGPAGKARTTTVRSPVAPYPEMLPSPSCGNWPLPGQSQDLMENNTNNMSTPPFYNAPSTKVSELVPRGRHGPEPDNKAIGELNVIEFDPAKDLKQNKAPQRRKTLKRKKTDDVEDSERR